jgi:hypothetical protein
MSTSLNGWKVIKPGKPGLVTREVPGTGVRLTLNKDAAGLLLYVSARVHNEVHSISANNKAGQDDAGYTYREARFADKFSNHASGTAVDLNWRRWPMLGKARSMNKKEQAAASVIAEDVKEVVMWGGNWRSIKDEMHWEIAPRVTAEQVAAFCKKRGIQEGGTVGAPAPAKPAKKPAKKTPAKKKPAKKKPAKKKPAKKKPAKKKPAKKKPAKKAPAKKAPAKKTPKKKEK